MYSEDLILINSFHSNLAHSKSSIKSYKTVFNKYCDFHGMSLSSLVDEAIVDQVNQVPYHDLKIIYRLNSFKEYLIKNYSANTVLSSFSKIKTFYKCCGVKLPYLPMINSVSLKKDDGILWEDMLKKEELIKIFNICDDDFRNWFLFMLSSGSSRIDCFNITNHMFLNATYPYHKQMDFKKSLNILKDRDDVVPCFKLKRQKTGRVYYMFISPECVKSIVDVKLDSCDFDLDNYLLRHDIDWLGRKCRFYNSCLNLGYASSYVRLRPHMLRKFYASQLNQSSLEDDFLLNRELIDTLQGRCKSRVQNAYFKDNPNFLKLSYVKCLNKLSLFHYYEWQIVDGDIKIIPRRIGNSKI